MAGERQLFLRAEDGLTEASFLMAYALIFFFFFALLSYVAKQVFEALSVESLYMFT